MNLLEELLESAVFQQIPKKLKPLNPLGFKGFNGAAGRIRTADLILTKDALYRLSYSSMYVPFRGTI